MRTFTFFSAVVVLGMVVGPGCGDDDNYGDAALAKLRSCDLLTAGRYAQIGEPESPDEQCEYDCALAASCDDLTAMMCQVGTISAATEACFDGCGASSNDFVCVDGSDTIPEDWVCDGYDDCDDASDEVGCPTFDCVDGLDTIPVSSVCDGYEECVDGSDEVDCPGFECADGTYTIPEDYVCDFYEDCDDGSDEVGCPTPPQFQCADGSFINDYLDCDGELDCPDGSDEAGCAEMTCPQ